VVLVDAAQPVVEVEPFVLPTGANIEVGGEPTVSTGTADMVGRRFEEEGTPPCTSAGHCWMKLP
jgi:hypothetical protein